MPTQLLEPKVFPLEGGKTRRLTITQFIEEYDYVVRTVILRYVVPSRLGDISDDLDQEIWRQFLEGNEKTNHQSYWNIYNPAESSPVTFLYEFAKRRCLQFLSRSHRTPTARAYSIQPQPDDVITPGIVDPETTPELGFDEFENIEYADLVARATRAIHRQKIRGRRDLRWIWYLLRDGWRQDQIAAEMGLSEGTISICMDLIRQIDEVQALKTWAIEKGILAESRPL